MTLVGLAILIFSILPSAYRYLRLGVIPSKTNMMLMFVVTTLFIVEKAVSVYLMP